MTVQLPKRLIDKAIASRDNAVFRALADCLTSKGIKKHGLFLVSGEKVVRDVLTRHPEAVRDLILCADLHLDGDERPLSAAVTSLIESTRELCQNASVMSLVKPLFEALDAFGTRSPLLVLSAWPIPVADLATEPRGLEILCALSDPSNLGALIRSAAAFGATKVILLKESASPFHPRAVRAAAGTTFEVSFARGPSIRDSACEVVALDMAGEDLGQFIWPENCRLLLGEEGLGIPASARLKAVAIPISSGVESLNATVAASIALYSYSKR